MSLIAAIAIAVLFSSMMPSLLTLICFRGDWKQRGESCVRMFTGIFLIYFAASLLLVGFAFFLLVGRPIIGLACAMGFGVLVGFVTLGGRCYETGGSSPVSRGTKIRLVIVKRRCWHKQRGRRCC